MTGPESGASSRVLPQASVVDGRPGGAIDAVRPDGSILFAFEMLNDLFAYIAEQLVRRAPVLTGAYREAEG